MKQHLKKLTMTLVALLAVTTGAWATVYTSEVDSKVVKVGDILAGGVSLLPPSYVGECNLILGLGRFRSNKVEYTLDHLVYCGAINSIGENAVILMNGAAPETFTPVDENGQDGNAWLVTGISGDGQNFIEIGVCGTYYDPNYDPSALKVAWDNDKKTGTFTMPGGNVELEPEYYPQAALTAEPTAINDVPATTDGAIVKAGTVKNIGETTTAQGTVMYYVSPSPLDDAALLALAADAWTADVPTAESLAQGQAYVYYYVRGNDGDTDETTFSDGDILAANALNVTIAAAPTYAVTFAEGVNPEPPAQPEWTASPATDVTKGQTVTVTYSGTKKVLGVKAEKKAAAPATVLSGALVDGAIIKVNFKWRMENSGDYVQGVYNAASGTFTTSRGGYDWNYDERAVYKVEKSGNNIIIGASFNNFSDSEAMVWTFNTTNDTYTTTNGTTVNAHPDWYGLISVTLNGTDITSQLTAQ